MVMEASMIVVDNSDWMRNGDYTPTRLIAQNEAVNLIFNAKVQSNPENTVGLMTMAGKSPEVLVTLTTDVGKILSALHGVKSSGQSDFITGVQIAQLALKHRQNRNQRQRIVVFVGSPVDVDERTLVRLAKKLKKNNVAIDVINFGEETANTSKLDAFINNVNNSDNSHLVTIPPGPHILSDMLMSTAIISGEDGAPSNFSSGGDMFEFGIDPNQDPELALALRISMEEEKARQEASSKKSGKPESSESGEAMVVDGASGAQQHHEDDDELQAALAMSMGQSHVPDEDVDMDEDEELQRALEMSMNDNNDDEMMSAVLGSLPGVDPNDARIQKALEDMQDKKKDKEDK
ncbi:hypothetical protein DM01DRAFT_1334186 [Hesseltinella vesiculosa]|uniref:VWFA domain-containing protein n=1 Tax=Hesseltinella vesiculosa TaxID=101127 RepID=A0A1X2GN42_9FUNG|nr:hypothetical protein DM01DRAFT_1334186 [Hesseltinella vesiculosa]